MGEDKVNTQDNSQIVKVIIVEKEQCTYDDSFMIDESNVLLNSINVKRIDEKTGKVYESEFSISFLINEFGERYCPVIHIKTNSTLKMKYIIKYKYFTNKFTYIIKPEDYMKCLH